MNRVLLALDALDLAEAKLDSATELLRARPANRVRGDQTEGDEEEIGLVDVAVVPVYDGDLGLGAIAAPELVGDQGAAGAGAQNENSFWHACIVHDETEAE